MNHLWDKHYNQHPQGEQVYNFNHYRLCILKFKHVWSRRKIQENIRQWIPEQREVKDVNIPETKKKLKKNGCS